MHVSTKKDKTDGREVPFTTIQLIINGNQIRAIN